MYELIEHRELSADASTITFSNIPQIYTDLKVVLKVRSARTGYDNDPLFVYPNGISTGFSSRVLRGTGSATNSFSASSNLWIAAITAATATSSTFANVELDIPNYTSNTYKSMSSSGVSENNGTTAYQILAAHLWSNNNPITSLEFFAQNGNLVQYSSATLYGVGRRQGIGRAPLAIGGNVAYDNGYWYHSFPSSGSFEPFVDLEVDYLIIAGGGGGGGYEGGGGGAGGLRSTVDNTGGGGSLEPKLSLTANTLYPVTVGAGGGAGSFVPGTDGGNSTLSTITAIGGGGGGSDNTTNMTGRSGGSGGGGGNSYNNHPPTGGAGTPGQGFDGGDGNLVDTENSAGGGGGAGAPGQLADTTSGAAGGDGVVVGISGTLTYYAGGGGGGSRSASGGAGGRGGGGTGTSSTSLSTAGATNTGGGGGGSGNNAYIGGSAGGSGIVIVRYKA